MWAVGCVMYQCLTGSLPFNPATKALSTDVSFSRVHANISAGAKELVGLLLQRNESDRLTAHQALQHKWFLDMSFSDSI